MNNILNELEIILNNMEKIKNLYSLYGRNFCLEIGVCLSDFKKIIVKFSVRINKDKINKISGMPEYINFCVLYKITEQDLKILERIKLLEFNINMLNKLEKYIEEYRKSITE